MRTTTAGGVAGTLALLGVLVSGCGGDEDGADDGDTGATSTTTETFCAGVTRVGRASGLPGVRRALAALGTGSLPEEMSRDERAGLRLAVRLTGEARSTRAARAAVERLGPVGKRRLADFSGYAVTTCAADPLGRVRPRGVPSTATSGPSGELPSGSVTELPTGLPTDIFPELSDFPTDWSTPRPTEVPSGIPSDMLSDWKTMYPSDGATTPH